MPPQEEHEKSEDMVEAPHEAERAARTLEDAVDSHATLDGYYAMNNIKPPEELEALEHEKERPENRGEDRKKGHPAS